MAIEYRLQEVEILIPDDNVSIGGKTGHSFVGFPGLVAVGTGLAIISGITEDYNGGYSITHMQSGYDIPLPARIDKLTQAQQALERIVPLLPSWDVPQKEVSKAILATHGSMSILIDLLKTIYEEICGKVKEDTHVI